MSMPEWNPPLDDRRGRPCVFGVNVGTLAAGNTSVFTCFDSCIAKDGNRSEVQLHRALLDRHSAVTDAREDRNSQASVRPVAGLAMADCGC
jgi:hypothetical protein